LSCKNKLFEIRRDLKSNNFEFSIHAYERMVERGIFATDILALIKNGLKHSVWIEKHGSWNFSGQGIGPDIITIACTYNNYGTLIVTVFWK